MGEPSLEHLDPGGLEPRLELDVEALQDLIGRGASAVVGDLADLVQEAGRAHAEALPVTGSA